MHQLDLPLQAEPPTALFFALQPDAGTAGRIVSLAHSLRAGLGLRTRLRPPELFHVTLHFLGNHAGVPPSLLAKARAAADTVCLRRFKVAFDRAESFAGGPERRPFVLRGDEPALRGARALHEALGKQLALTGIRVQRGFTPHLTLLYDDGLLPAQPFGPVEWEAHEFVLIQSHSGRSRHEVLARWPLQDA